MQKLTMTVVSLICFYVVPLAGNMALFADPKIYVLMFTMAVLFISQPSMSMSEATDVKDDNKDVLMFTLGITVSQIVTVVDWAYLRLGSELLSAPVLVYFGAALMLIGTLYRIWSIRVLGKFFSLKVEFQDEHKIIQTGPYKLLRHPSYVGAYAVMIGIGLFMQSLVGLLTAAMVMAYVYQYRIRIEEAELCKQFGDAYRQYQASTYRMIPYIW